MEGEADTPAQQEGGEGEEAVLVRWCRRGQDLLNLRANVLTQDSLDSEDKEKLSEALLESIHDASKLPHELSVYRAETASPDELGHAIATIAMCIARSRKAEELATPPHFGVSMVISETSLVEAVIPAPHTPDGCTSLSPGRPFHHDIKVEDKEAADKLMGLCARLLVKQSTLTEVTPLDESAGQSAIEIRRRRFNEQATSVLTRCEGEPYRLGKKSVAEDKWDEPPKVSGAVKVSEQIKRLRKLAELVGYKFQDEQVSEAVSAAPTQAPHPKTP